jgi:hypothetical protein
LQKQEEKIYRKRLHGNDSLQAKAELAAIKDKYKVMQDKLNDSSSSTGASQYISKLDTLTTSLKLLDQIGVGGSMKAALAKTQSLQNKFQQAEEIKKFIRERKERLRGELEKLGLTKQLKKFNKQV